MKHFIWLLPVILEGNFGVSALLLPNPAKLPKLPVPVTIDRVIDGDTLVGSIDQVQIHVRLCGIDAPEKKQLLGPDAKQMLTTLVGTGKTTLVVVGKDSYGRTIGSLYVDNSSVQAKMAIQGLAYYYKSQGVCPDRAEIIAADNYARSNKIGMRGIPGFVPPWEYRIKHIFAPPASSNPDPIVIEPLLVAN